MHGGGPHDQQARVGGRHGLGDHAGAGLAGYSGPPVVTVTVGVTVFTVNSGVLPPVLAWLAKIMVALRRDNV